jgi:anti-sigma B factor antagonist/stage II sporulation protein AA (anti-sigma F factor antagonist)
VELSNRQFADVIVATPVGRIDHAAATRLEAALSPLIEQSMTRTAGLVLDFAGVEYISSVGLRVLMVAAKRLRTCNARIAVAALQPVVAEIFAISRFGAVLDIHSSVRAALGDVSPAALAAFDASHGSAPT